MPRLSPDEASDTESYCAKVARFMHKAQYPVRTKLPYQPEHSHGQTMLEVMNPQVLKPRVSETVNPISGNSREQPARGRG